MNATPDNVKPAVHARHMLRRASRAALATIDRAAGHPYASLVAMGTMPDGAPILLISRLALHTQNLGADARASLLIDAGAHGDPLASGRVTLIGSIKPAMPETTAKHRYLAQHPAAAGYAGFADFRFFILELERAHYVGGFGRISPLSRSDLLIDVSGAAELIAAEPELIPALNRDWAPELSQLGARLSGGRAGPWRITGIDPEGYDLALAGERCRGEFTQPVATADEARNALSAILGINSEAPGSHS